MSGHARLAPSAAKRWINCPASVALIEKLPSRPAGYAAAEGTVAHDIHERFHEGKLEYIEMVGLIGTTVMQEGHEVEITEEMIESAERYHEMVLADVARIEAVKKPAAVVSKTEAKVSAAQSIDPDCKGTADKLIYRKGDRLIVRDLKFGREIVDVEENEQMSVYAVAAMDSEAGWAFDEVELVVDQPRADHEDGRERRWITTPAALKTFAARAKAAAAETKNPQAVLKAGPWCRSTYCPVMSKCPAAQGMAQDRAKAVFSEITPALPPTATSEEKRLAAYKEMRLPDVKLLTDTQLVDAKRWKEAVLGFFNAVDEDLEARLLAGATIPGVKVVDGRSFRKWKDEAAVEAKFGEAAFERKLLSPAKLEALKGKKAGVDELTYKPEPKKLVVLATDARPAAKANAVDVFGVIESTAEVVKPSTGDPLNQAADETPCVECEIVGECSRHKKKGPLWPQ